MACFLFSVALVRGPNRLSWWLVVFRSWSSSSSPVSGRSVWTGTLAWFPLFSTRTPELQIDFKGRLARRVERPIPTGQVAKHVRKPGLVEDPWEGIRPFCDGRIGAFRTALVEEAAFPREASHLGLPEMQVGVSTCAHVVLSFQLEVTQRRRTLLSKLSESPIR